MTEMAQVSTETLITLTSDIVAAHVSFNDVPVGRVPALIEKVFGALAGLSGGAATSAPPPEPAVSIRASVSPDQVICLDCGRKMKVLKRHLANDHGLSTAEYRQRFGNGGQRGAARDDEIDVLFDHARAPPAAEHDQQQQGDQDGREAAWAFHVN